MSSTDGLERKVEKYTQHLEEKLSVLQNMLNAINVAVWSYDADSRKYVYLTEAIEEITGYSTGQLSELSFWFSIIHEDDLPIFEQLWAPLRQGLPARSEYRIYHANGECKWIQIRIMPTLNDAGMVTRLDGAVLDITSSKALEEALHRSEQRYKSLFEHNSDVIFELDLEGTVLAINPAAESLAGAEHLEQAIRGRSESYEVTFFHPEDDMNYWDMKHIPIFVNEQVVGAFAIAKDRTEKKRAEKALSESEESYRRLVELSPVAIAVYKEGAVTYINPAGVKMLSKERQIEPFEINIMERVHPNYREYARERMQNTLRNGYSPPGEYKIINFENNVLDVKMISTFDPHTSSIQLMFEDITARKQAEKALLESDELNRRLIELSPEAIVLHSSFHFIYVNPAGLALFNVTSMNELIGHSIFDWIHTDNAERVTQCFNEIYNEPKVSPIMEQRIVRADGSMIDVEVISSTIPYRGENAAISLFRDIGERKKAEEDRKLSERIIRDNEERYYRLLNSLDRFSHDLFGVMNIGGMEKRIVNEVREVLKVSKVSFIEMDANKDWIVRYGERNLPFCIQEEMSKHKSHSACKIRETDEGCYLKFGEFKEKAYLLYIGEKPQTLNIPSKRVWLETITRFVTVLLENFLLIEDLTTELERMASEQVAPTWLLRLLFNLSENERKRLSQDLHDAALQEQIVWYRRLDLLLTDESIFGNTREQLEQVSQGLLDVIYQIRITCNELRPPLLKEEGLTSSLEALFDFMQLRTNYSICFDATRFENTVNDDLLIGIYRIVQELLANATKHSQATEVGILLENMAGQIKLVYKDNGIGMDDGMEDSFGSMGIYGMKERVRSMDGTIEFRSAKNEGLTITIFIPIP